MAIDIEKVAPKVCKQFEKWRVQRPRRNIWIADSTIGLSLYLREGYHLLPTGIATTLDIGSIALSEGVQCKGIGTALINYLHARHEYAATYIENILTPRFHRHLVREGWITIDLKDITPCVYKVRGL